MGFVKATKKKAKLRLAIEGASGSGKTYSALLLASGFGGRIAVIDTEHGSASLYSDKFDFDVLELKPPYTPEAYISAIREAEKAGYDILIIDSASHEWNGQGGCLDLITQIGGNSYAAWGKVTPRHEAFINAILMSPMHVIATMRSKANYETGKDDKGRMTIEKQGTAPIQRDGVDFEFTIVFDLNQNHMAKSTKDRSGLFDGKDEIITPNTAKKLLAWLNDGGEPIAPKVEPTNGEAPKPALKAEVVPADRNYTEEAAKCKTLDDLRNWYVSLPKEMKASLKALKDNRKTEIEQELNSLKQTIIQNLPAEIDKLQKGITELELSRFTSLIDDYPGGEEKAKIIKQFNDKMAAIGSKFEYTGLPF